MLISVGGSQVGDAECLDNVIAHNKLSNPWAGNMGLTWKARQTLIEHNRILFDEVVCVFTVGRSGFATGAER